MTVSFIPIMTAMYLGSSFNLKTYLKGNADVYDTTDIKNNIHVIDRSFTRSQYKLIESSLDARKFLDVDGALSLKIKKGDVQIEGSGAYLSETANRENFVELLIRVQHETVTETIPSHLKPRTDWMSMKPKSVGTHFVRSITYGGELIATFRLKASNSEQREKIKAAVTTNLQLTGTFGVNASGSFDQLRKDLKGMYDEDIKVTVTGKPKSVESIEKLMEIVENYPNEIRQINGGKGKALMGELYPLSSLKSDFPLYLSNRAMSNMIDDIESKFDDIRITMDEFTRWIKARPGLDDDDEEKIQEFMDEISPAQRAFNLAIADMDLSSTGDVKQFAKALQAYGEGSKNVPNRFQREFKKLKHNITGEELIWKKPKGSGIIYVNWGSNKCKSASNTDTKVIYSGYAAGTSQYAWNSGKNTECLPEKKPQLSSVLRSVDSTAWIQTIQYRDPKNAETTQFLPCAVCLAKGKIIQEVFSGTTKCPEDWSLEYPGYLMADSSSNVDREFLCVNKKTDSTQPFDSAVEMTPKINSVFMTCEKCSDEKIVPCVVCTK